MRQASQPPRVSFACAISISFVASTNRFPRGLTNRGMFILAWRMCGTRCAATRHCTRDWSRPCEDERPRCTELEKRLPQYKTR